MPNKKLEKLVEVVAALRDPETGCPWDLEQDHNSLKPYIIEEAYEVLDAIDSKNDDEFADELGDLLLQVVLHSQLANERKAFNVEAVIEKITDKMIRRHPHVFGDGTAKDSSEVLSNWEEIKASEKKDSSIKGVNNKFTEILNNIPKNLPALLRADKIGGKSAKFNFDWDKCDDVFKKVKEEIGELEQEYKKLRSENLALDHTKPLTAKNLTPEQKNKLEHEIGDLLFSISQFSRWLGLSAEQSLRTCNNRFINRIKHAEANSKKALNELSTNELQALWDKAKEFQALKAD